MNIMLERERNMDRPEEMRQQFIKTLQSEEFINKIQQVNPDIDAQHLCTVFITKDANGDFASKMGCASNKSLYSAILQCAAYGLEPLYQRVYLIVKGSQVETKLSYMGLLKLVHKHAKICLEAHNVYEGDEFSIDYSSEGQFIHRPLISREQKDSDLIGSYCWYRTTDGVKRLVWIPRNGLEQIRKASRGGTTWSSYYGEMCLKAVYRRALKILLQYIDDTEGAVALSRAIDADDKANSEDDVLDDNESAETSQSASGRLASKFSK